MTVGRVDKAPSARAYGTPLGRLPDGLSLWANRHRKWLFTGPALAFVATLLAFPIGYTVFLSLTDATGSLRFNLHFVGLQNYLTALTDTDRFWPAVGRTIVFTVGAVGVELVLGMAVALLLWRPFRGDRWVRALIMLPLVAPPIAVGLMWLLIFQPTIGIANELLAGFGIAPQGWISDPSQALPTVMLIDIWQWTPMMTLILLAGLTSLPRDLDEAARVDGGNALQRFRYVTLPLLMPTVIAALVLRGIDGLKTFDILYATLGSGGGSIHEGETLNVYAYSLNFGYNEYGLAAAVLVLYFIMIAGAVSLLLVRPRRRG